MLADAHIAQGFRIMAHTRQYIIAPSASASSDLVGQPSITIRQVDLEAPWRWLAAGWADLVAMPHISLTYGAVFTLFAAGFWLGLVRVGWQSLMLALAGGFLLIGPVLAVGLYEASRRRQLGLAVHLGDVFAAGFRGRTQLSLLGLALLLIYMVWVQTAFLLFMLFFSDAPFPPLEDFVPRLLFSWQGVTLLIAGTIEGALLAALVFSIAVISAPMLMERPVGVATGIAASVRAVLHNPMPMLLWATLIGGFVAAGLATLCLGLIVIFPLIGHATWHAYRDIVAEA
jgi:uncharacterized membrane protein